MAYKELVLENKITNQFVIDYSILDMILSTLVLQFDMESQTQSNWCWAATSKSVSKFYSALSPWTQCKVASEELDNTCCDSPVPSACNVSWYLDKALTRTNNFVSMQSGTISWSKVKQELQNGLVVGARIGWNGGGGHFMVIHGVSKSNGVEYLHIDDPIYGKSTLTYTQFATNYQNSGTWTHTYFTKKHFYFMWFKELALNPELLKPIREIRPLLNVYGEKIETLKDLALDDVGIPHYIFDVKLDEISARMKAPQSPSSLRVMELKNDKPVASYELGLNPRNPELIQMNTDKNLFELMNNSLSRLKLEDQKNKSVGELRTIRIQALNMEAVWLNYPGRMEDLVCVLPRLKYNSIKTDTVYPISEFLKLLQREKSQMGKFDELTGA